MIAGALLGLLFAFLYHKYKVDLVILAIAFNLIIIELTVFVMRAMFGNVGTWSDPSIVRLPNIEIPIIKDIPVLGDILSGYNIIVYFSWLATIVMFIVLYKMRSGRHLRGRREQGRGETVGINAILLQTLALVICGALAGLGGAFLSIGHLTLFTRNMSNGRGWIAIAAAMFGMNHPFGVFFLQPVLRLCRCLKQCKIQATTDLPPNLVKLLPNLATLLVLIIIALRSKLCSQHGPPPLPHPAAQRGICQAGGGIEIRIGFSFRKSESTIGLHSFKLCRKNSSTWIRMSAWVHLVQKSMTARR